MSVLLAVFRFEWHRTMTSSRLAWWFALAGFPVFIVLLIRWAARHETQSVPDEYSRWSVVLYLLIPCVSSTLGVFLSAAPAIAGELEQRSWVYMATRPYGVLWLLLGKYLVAIVWGSSAAVAGLTVAVPLTKVPIDSYLTLWTSMASLSLLSCGAYGAVYLLIGTITPKRAMVFCVAYTGAVEIMISLIPAVINRMTVQFRLRSLFINWVNPSEDIRNDDFFQYVFADGASWMQIVWLFALTSLFLLLAIVVAHRREFTSAAESDI